MKKFLAIVLILVLTIFLLAACKTDGGDTSSGNGNDNGNSSQSDAKFSGEYNYNPPTDNYFVKYTLVEDGRTETFYTARIGKGYSCTWDGANNYVSHFDYENNKTYMRDSDGTWYGDSDYSEYGLDDYGDNIGPLSAMDDNLMYYIRMFGFEDRLDEYYVGTEKVAGINCWVFDSKGINALYMKFWVDPSNGCTLKYLGYEGSEIGYVYEVTEYNLNYKQWTENLKPDNYDTVVWP